MKGYALKHILRSWRSNEHELIQLKKARLQNLSEDELLIL